MNPNLYGVISDVHLHNWSSFSTTLPSGVNSRLEDILYAVKKAAITVLDRGGKTLYITGDLFHVRGSVSPQVLNPTIDLFRELAHYGLEVVILAGNHDLESRDSEALSNACEALRMMPRVTVVSERSVFLEPMILMIPWYDDLNRVRAEIKAFCGSCSDLEDWTLMLHAPLNGVIAGLPDHGFYAAELASFGFGKVFCGHHHNFRVFNSPMGSRMVYSVGAATHQTWGDVGTKAGFLIVDGDCVEHHESDAPRFIDYDAGWDDDQAIEHCTGNFVRVRLGEATDEERQLIRDHVVGLGALGVIVESIPTLPSNAASGRTASVTKAPTVRESIDAWTDMKGIKSPGLDKLIGEIMTEVESMDE